MSSAQGSAEEEAGEAAAPALDGAQAPHTCPLLETTEKETHLILPSSKKYDRYGFPVDKYKPREVLEKEALYEVYLIRHRREWMRYLMKISGRSSRRSPEQTITSLVIDVPEQKLVRSQDKKLKKLIRGGVPPSIRPVLWMKLTGAFARMKANEGYYHRLHAKHAGIATSHTQQIALDIRRMYLGHQFLDQPGIPEMMHRVLTVYSWKNRRVGYCQSMNYIVSILLIITRDEVRAFWLLTALLDRLPTDYYSQTLWALLVDLRVLEELVLDKYPQVSAHAKRLGVSWQAVCTEWFLCLFARTLPFETAMRVWDVFFGEGQKILFRVALALLQLARPRLLRADSFLAFMEALNAVCAEQTDPDRLIGVALDGIGSFPAAAFVQLRMEFEEKIRADLERLERRRAAMKRRAEE